MPPKKLKRVDIRPDLILEVKPGKVLDLDACYILSRTVVIVPSGTRLRVVTKPRKLDGINIVRVRRDAGPYMSGRPDDTNEYEVYYCDLVNNCESI